MKPGQTDLEYVAALKYGEVSAVGWGPHMRRRFGYFTPDEYYEALVSKLIRDNTVWLDVGCGSDLFPNNRNLATLLSGKCRLLVGVDPDPAINENPFVHERFQGFIEDFHSEKLFDVITLRMVTEHVTDPRAVIEVLDKLLQPSGRIIIYTVNKWAIVPIVTRLLPFRLHHPIKKVLWGTKEEETFPTYYRMNTRAVLSQSFARKGYQEASFAYLDDCRSFARFRSLHFMELSLRWLLNKLGRKYLDTCLLCVYSKKKV